jgi:hypothetical protein
MSNETEYFSQNLRCDLTADEIAERAQQSARLVVTIDDLTASMKAEAKRRKSFIEEKEGELRRISAEVRDKATFRDIECERRFDYRMGIVVEVRLDSGEVLNERAMTHHERQMALELEPANDTIPAAPLEEIASNPGGTFEHGFATTTDNQYAFSDAPDAPIRLDNPDADALEGPGELEPDGSGEYSPAFEAMLDRCSPPEPFETEIVEVGPQDIGELPKSSKRKSKKAAKKASKRARSA